MMMMMIGPGKQEEEDEEALKLATQRPHERSSRCLCAGKFLELRQSKSRYQATQRLSNWRYKLP